MSRAALEPTRWDDASYRARAAEAKTRSLGEAGRSVAEDLAEALAELDDAAVDAALSELSPLEWSRLLWGWEFWSRQKQREPPGDWLIWLILTGRNFGKTRTAAEWVRDRVCSGKARVIGLVGPTHGDIRKFMLGGHLSQSRDGTPRLDAKRQNSSGLLDVFPPHQRPHFDANKGEVTFHTGAVAFITTAEEPEMRGGNFDTIWGDELAKWRYLEELWYNLEMTCRVPPSPRILITTTPKNLPRLRALIADPDTHVTLGHTNENAAHTAAKWLEKMMRSYGGTRTGDQELGGEILEDNEGALWTSPEIEDHRLYDFPALKQIAVSVDPAVSKTRRSDATGIVVDGLGAENGHIYTLADKTKKYASDEWGDVVIAEWERWSKVAPCVIVVERNRQGDGAAANVRAAMYRRTVKSGGDNAKAESAKNALRIVEVLAMGDKAQRAEPVAMLAKRGLVHHVGPREKFRTLEAEKTGWDPNLNPDSPNAIDAHVHGVTYLIPEIAGALGAEDMSDRFRGLEAANRSMEEPGADTWDVIA